MVMIIYDKTFLGGKTSLWCSIEDSLRRSCELSVGVVSWGVGVVSWGVGVVSWAVGVVSCPSEL